MASGGNVGNAYITVTPKLADGFDSTIASRGTSSGAEYGGKFSAAATRALDTFSVMAGNILANAVTAVSSKIGEVFADTFNNYADYEQLVGGVDTLFKESSGVVQQYAANAYKTAGMSANDYMEQVTSFSASLLQGLGGDTEAAAKYADMAMTDMSDNANKMGTDMGRISDAYQGFAKQNYTMLDNLKLGYGGTKGEMERLLKDASKIAGVDFNIDNYNDVIEAIHVMQNEMGITGTTALEAEKTISGSINMLKASWTNLLTGVLDENADMGKLFEELFSSIMAVVRNLIPRFGVLFMRLFLQLPQAMVSAIESMPDMLLPFLQKLFGRQMGKTVSNGMKAAFAYIKQAITTLLDGIMNAIKPVVQNVVSLVKANLPTIQKIITNATNFIGGVVKAVWPAVSSIIVGAMNTISAIISALWPAISDIVNKAMTMISNVTSTMWPKIQALISTVMTAIRNIISVAWPIIQGIVTTVMGAILGVINTVWPAIELVVSGAMTFISGVIDAAMAVIKLVTGQSWGEISATIGSALTGISEAMNGAWTAITETVGGAMSSIGGVIDAAWPVIQAVMDTAMYAIQGVVVAVWPSIQGVVEGAVSVISGAIGGMSGLVSGVSSTFYGILSAISGPLESAKSIVSDAIGFIQGVINGAYLSLPHFSLPHFNIYGGELPWGIGGYGTPPSISVEWYAKGGFVDGATLIGAGEAGPEMVLPKKGALMEDFSEAVASHVDTASIVYELRRFERLLGPTIADYAPKMTTREFNRAARGAVANG